MRDFFARAASVRHVRKRPRKPFAYIEFESERDVDRALKLNDRLLLGRPISVQRSKPPTRPRAPTLKAQAPKSAMTSTASSSSSSSSSSYSSRAMMIPPALRRKKAIVLKKMNRTCEHFPFTALSLFCGECGMVRRGKMLWQLDQVAAFMLENLRWNQTCLGLRPMFHPLGGP